MGYQIVTLGGSASGTIENMIKISTALGEMPEFVRIS